MSISTFCLDINEPYTFFSISSSASIFPRSNNLVGYVGQGAPDTGSSIACAPDIDHMNDRVRADIKSWMGMLFNDVGFGALRLDMAAGYSPKYQVKAKV